MKYKIYINSRSQCGLFGGAMLLYEAILSTWKAPLVADENTLTDFFDDVVDVVDDVVDDVEDDIEDGGWEQTSQ